MANSYLNIVTFLFTTIIYYFIKPTLTYQILNNEEEYKKHLKSNYLYLAVYLVLVLVVQFIVNASIISTTCGGEITENMGAAGVFTFIPWILIFGVVIVILTIFPGFKSAFSDVVGYFYVSGQANNILTELLVNPDIEKKMNGDKPASPSTEMTGGAEIDQNKRAAMQDAADAIIKICGNTSILINQIVPSNFVQYWDILTPLMKEKYQTPGPDSQEIKDHLFSLVVTRDNIGEAMWYLYTGILLTSIVQLKLTSRGCVSNPKTMEQNYQKFLQVEQQNQAKQAKIEGTTYTITG
uniref:Uncharacterized protein n=1 Tax=viral metagenome TaxID=1070528 RepID=A0A6C0AS05_9ZZZZ